MTAKQILEKHANSEICEENFYFESEALAAMEEYAAAMKEKYRERAIRMFTYGRNGHSIESALQAWDKEEI